MTRDPTGSRRRRSRLPDRLADAILHALEAGDQDELRFLAAQAVDLHSGIGAHEGSQRYFLHRVLRAVDLTADAGDGHAAAAAEAPPSS